MCDDICVERNRYLDQILADRRSHRQFRPEPCSDEEILRVLHAGLLAPYAAAAVGTSRDYFRRFFVIRRESAAMKAVIPLVKNRVNLMADRLRQEMRSDPALREIAAGFAGRLEMMQSRGIVFGVGTAPFYVIAAERRGYPPVGPQSLAHCMENMWLKATALDLGFQIVSITAEMATDPAFCSILGIAPGDWDLMGCAIGYASDELSPSIRPPVEDVTRWLD